MENSRSVGVQSSQVQNNMGRASQVHPINQSLSRPKPI